MKSLLLICRQAPRAGVAAREMLDIALAGGAFDLPIAMLFMDDGVLQLCPAQAPKSLEQKDLQANLNALEMFGVDELYAEAHSLKLRAISQDGLTLNAAVLEAADVKALIARFDQVITL